MFDPFRSAEEAVKGRLIEFLMSKTEVRVLGPQTGDRSRRMPTIAFRSEQRTSESVVKSLASRSIAAAFGNFYSIRCLQALGIEDTNDGVIRLSLLHYNSSQELDRLIDALEEALGQSRCHGIADTFSPAEARFTQ